VRRAGSYELRQKRLDSRATLPGSEMAGAVEPDAICLARLLPGRRPRRSKTPEAGPLNRSNHFSFPRRRQISVLKNSIVWPSTLCRRLCWVRAVLPFCTAVGGNHVAPSTRWRCRGGKGGPFSLQQSRFPGRFRTGRCSRGCRLPRRCFPRTETRRCGYRAHLDRSERPVPFTTGAVFRNPATPPLSLTGARR